MKKEFIASGVTRTSGRLIENSDGFAVEIGTSIKEKNRLQVFLSKSISAVSQAEIEVNSMSNDDILKYIEDDKPSL